MPKNQGGSDDISKLQALCFHCNAGKARCCLPTQEGRSDFRGLLENGLVLCIADAYPLTPGTAW